MMWPSMMVAPPHDSEPSPPQYTCLRIADREAAVVEDVWEAMIPRRWQMLQWFNLEFTCTPEIFHKNKNFMQRTLRDRKTQPYWKAKLFIRAKNIPRLMRRGFHLSEADLIPGCGEIHFDDKERAEEVGFDPSWRHRRCYYFMDAAGDPEWNATLEVFARSPSIVMNFRLEGITPDTVFLAYAYRWDKKPVYKACRLRSNHSFNTLFDEMPTGGWWPAPKEMQEQSKPRSLRLSGWLRTKTKSKDGKSTA